MLYNIADHVSHCLFTINIVYYSAPVIPVTASVLYPGLDTYAAIIIMGPLVLPPTMVGITLPSTTLRLCKPWTLSLWSRTVPMAQVPTGW